MELTRFDMQNQAIQRRIAEALERIAAAVEKVAGIANAEMGAALETAAVAELSKEKKR